MPYIKQVKRPEYDPHIEKLMALLAVDQDGLDGNLNYVISRIVIGSLKPVAGWPWRYASIARVAAVFECAKLEFYRRIGAVKEDEAIKANGDIPEYDSIN